MTNRVSESKTYAAFAGAVVIGGANFIAVSMSNMELPPLFGATFRFALGTVLFLLISGLARIPLARNREAAGAALYGLFGFGAAYALLYYALRRLGLDTDPAARRPQDQQIVLLNRDAAVPSLARRDNGEAWA